MQLKRAYLFFALLIIAVVARAQDAGYFIRNYPPKEYKGFNQVWQAVQDKNGVMYFAGTSNVFVFYGQSWETIPVKAGAANRQIVLDSTDGTIYVSAVGEFGYLARNTRGKLHYVSISAQIEDEAQKAFSDVWEIHLRDGNLYFQAGERIFIVRDKKITGVIDAPQGKGFALSFSSRGRLFVRQRTVGLMEIKGDQLVLVPGGEVFGSTRLLGIMPWTPGMHLVMTGDEGFVLMSDQPRGGSCFQPFPLPPDTFLTKSGVLGLRWVNDSTFAINSRMGLAFYDKNGSVKEVLEKKSGLPDGSIAEVFVDRERNLWLMHNNGMSRISYNSPALFYTDQSGFFGTVEMMHPKGKELYLATTEGFFRRLPAKPLHPSGLHFEQIDVMRIEVWDITDYGDDLLLSTSFGLLLLRDGKEELLTDQYTNRATYSRRPHELMTAEKGALGIFHAVPGKKPVLVRRYQLPGQELLRIGGIDTVPGRPGERTVWGMTRYKSLMKMQFNLADTAIQAQEYDTSRGFPMMEYFPIRIDGNTYLFNTRNCYRYDASLDKGAGSKCFVPAPEVHMRLAKGDLRGVEEELDHRLFLSSPREGLTTGFGYDAQHRPIARRIRPGMLFDDDAVQDIIVEPTGKAWLMSNDKIVRFTITEKPQAAKPFHTLIRQVRIGNDSLIFSGSDNATITNDTAIDYRFNSVSFNFAAPYFEYNFPIQFLYRLDGYDTAWSKPAFTVEKSYTNLAEGTYTFRVFASNPNDERSVEASYTFTILPPWYRTGWAYTLYGLGFIVVVLGSIKISVRRLQKAKDRLETIVGERTAEVVQQKQMLEVAYKDIQDSIHYAKRIQEAILPLDAQVTAVLPELFVLLYPRDIVSGDFYWFARRGNKAFIACVDCTGHGVPGAFMSMIGNTLLNEIVIEEELENPAAILQRLHLRVRQSLKQDLNSETRDGMDLSLCVVHIDSGLMEYAGANRPVFIVRKGELIELEPDKFSIGGYQAEEDRVFTPHSVQLKAEDRVYLFSDGYPDQFGGEKGKKFMIKRFREMVLASWQLPMKEQRAIFDQRFLSWKSGYEQTDDVLVIGFKYMG